MSHEIAFLLYLTFYLFAWFPASVAKYQSFGYKYLASNRSHSTGELSRWGARAIRAHANLKDYAPIFIATYLFAKFSNLSHDCFSAIVWTYVIARFGHFISYCIGHVLLRAIFWAFSILSNLYLIFILIMKLI